MVKYLFSFNVLVDFDDFMHWLTFGYLTALVDFFC
jgi:hypothetical protein